MDVEVEALRERLATLEADVAMLLAASGAHRTIPLSDYDPHAPRRTEVTTVINEVHPAFSNRPQPTPEVA
jgi:hypothetical protein